MTVSTSTPAASPAKAFACSRSHGDVGGGGGDQLRLLLQPEEDPSTHRPDGICAQQKSGVESCSCLLHAGRGRWVLRHRAVAPVPFDGGAVEISEVVAPVAKFCAGTHAQGGDPTGGVTRTVSVGFLASCCCARAQCEEWQHSQGAPTIRQRARRGSVILGLVSDAILSWSLRPDKQDQPRKRRRIDADRSSDAVGRCDRRAARDIDADLLVSVLDDDNLADEPDLDQASGGEISAARRRGEFKGKPYELFITTVARLENPARGAGRARITEGIRNRSPSSRRIDGGTGRASARHDALGDRRPPGRACISGDAAGRLRGAFCLILKILPPTLTGACRGPLFSQFKSPLVNMGPPRVWLDSVTLRVGGGANAVDRGAERGRVLGEYTNLARELANEPANTLTPRVFADRAAGMAREAGLAVDVLDEKRIAELKMGLLLGVAQGSAEPPRLVVLRHEPKSAAAQPVLGLIGKGITFDTGGISIKPAENMDKMKDDMSGGAAVLAAMCAISRLAHRCAASA